MKTFRKFCAALTLAAVLVLPGFAGDIQFPGAKMESEPPPPQCSTGDIQFPGAVSECEPPTEVVIDPTTGTTLTLLEVLLSLF